MDKKTQEVLFQNSVDMDLLAEHSNDLISTIEKAGDPKKVKIEIRKADEFAPGLSQEEIVDRIDREISKSNDVFTLDLLRVWKHGKYYLVLGVKL